MVMYVYTNYLCLFIKKAYKKLDLKITSRIAKMLL